VGSFEARKPEDDGGDSPRMTTTTPSAATSFIDIGERTNVTGDSVMLGLGPSIHGAAKEGGSGMRGAAPAEFFPVLPVSSWILGTLGLRRGQASPRMTVWGVSRHASPRMTMGGARA
jgi:hypothetical protein